ISAFQTTAADRGFQSDSGVATASPPPEVARVRHLNWFPPSLGVLLGGLAFIAVAHALVTSVRRRGRDLAVLKTLGFERRQVRATVGWQAFTLAFVGLAIGIPAGIVAGRLTWRLVAHVLGVSAAAPLPSL